MRESSIKWLVLSLLAGISVLSIAFYIKYFPKNNEAVSPPISNTADAATDDKKDNTPSDTPIIQLKPDVIYNSFPREAYLAGGATTQNAGGLKAETLMEVFCFDNISYLILQTKSNGYDFSATASSVAVAAIDNQLALTATLTLSDADDESFLAAKISPNGIFIATKAADYTKIYLVSLNLKSVESVKLDKAADASFYFLGNSVNLFLLSQTKLSYCNFDLNLKPLKRCDIALSEGESLAAVYPTALGAEVFVGGENGYSVYTLGGGSLKLSLNVLGYKIAKGLPCADGYVLLTKSSVGFFIEKLNFDLKSIASATLDTADKAQIVPYGNNYLVFSTSNEITKILLYCGHLEKIMTLHSFESETVVTEAAQTKNGLLLTAYSKNKLYLFNLSDNTLTPLIYFSAVNSYTRYINDTLYFTSSSKDGFFKNNYGESDVFIIKTASLL